MKNKNNKTLFKRFSLFYPTKKWLYYWVGLAIIVWLAIFYYLSNSFIPAENKNLLTLMNEARAQAGAPPLVFNDSLKESAKKKACQMRDDNLLAHEDREGRTSWHYFDEAGIYWEYKGENLGINILGDKVAFDAWMSSPEHRNNILDLKFNHVGWYWCDEYVAQHFGQLEKNSSTGIPTPTATQRQLNNAANPPQQPVQGATEVCHINSKCGGGTLDLPAGSCSRVTCCEIDNYWVLYMDKDQCRKDQEAYWNNYYGVGSNYTPPTYQPMPIPTFSAPVLSTPAYIPHTTVNLQNPPSNASLLQECISQVNSEYNSTMAVLRAQGMADSSSAVLAEQKRNNKIQQCQNQYGN